MSYIDRDFEWVPPGGAYSELQEKYASRSTYQLADRVKQDAAAAKRGATEMQKLFDQFRDVLGDDQLLALKAAVSVARKLATELDGIKPWSKAYEKHLQEKVLRENHERHMARAHKRWPTDAEAVAQAEDLVAYCDGASRAEIEAFIAQQHGCREGYISLSNSALPGRLREALSKQDMAQIRCHALSLIEGLGDGYRGQGDTWFAGKGDFHLWRTLRNDAKLALLALQRMSKSADSF